MEKRKTFWLTDFALRHRTTVLVLMILIILSGIVSYIELPREAAPDIKFPFIIVSTAYFGASPQDIESLITDPLEKKIKSIGDIEQVKSTSAESFSVIAIQFDTSVDIDKALQDVKDKVDQAKRDLPSDAEEPRIQEVNINDMPVMIVALSGEYGLVKLKNIAELLKDKIETIPGILDVQIAGGLEREIQIQVDLDKIKNMGYSLSDVEYTLKRENINIPGGTIPLGAANYLIRVPAEVKSVAEIAGLVVAVRNGIPITVADIADVVDTYKEKTSFARLNGKQSVSIYITKRSGENVIRMADDVRKVINDNVKELPVSTRINILADQSTRVRSIIKELENEIFTGLILVVAVLFAFVGFRNASIISLAMPLSMLIAFSVFRIGNITLNMVVMFGLILALGRLVDDAIVVVENIYRHMQEGYDKEESIRLAVGEVAWPVIASTATAAGAFLPMVLWPGIMGGFMKFLPITVITALSASLFIAIIINPVLCQRFMIVPKADRKSEESYGYLIKKYGVLLRSLLRKDKVTENRGSWWRWIGLGIAGIVGNIILSIVTNPHLDYGYYPNLIQKGMLILANSDLTIYFGAIFILILTYVFVSAYKPDRLGELNRFVFFVLILLAFIITLPLLAKPLVALRIVGKIGLAYVIWQLMSNATGFGLSATKRALIYLAFACAFFAAIFYLPALGIILFPGTTPEKIYIEVKAPEGSTVAYTDQIARQVEALVVPFKSIKQYVASIGISGQATNLVSGGESSNYAQIVADMWDEDEHRELLAEKKFTRAELDPNLTLAKLRQAVKVISGASIEVNVHEMGPPAGAAVSVQISGRDFKVLNMIAADIKKMLEGSPGVINLRDNYKSGRPELAVRINREKAAFYGINPFLISTTVRTAVNGTKISVLREGDDEYDITVRLKEEQRNSIESIMQITIPGGKQGIAQVPISEIAQFYTAGGIGSIQRTDYRRTIIVESDVDPASKIRPEQIIKALKARLISYNLPESYHIDFGGQNESQKEASDFLGKAFLIAIFIISMVLITQFNSVAMPFIILTSVLLSIIGVVIGLAITKTAFSIIMTGVGVICLAGIVVNNAIILLSYMIQRREQGEEKEEAIVHAGMIRFRPVMLTAIVTVLGLLPMSTGITLDFSKLRIVMSGQTSEMWGAMANAVIYGLITATILTLVLVPILYHTIDEISHKFSKPK